MLHMMTLRVPKCELIGRLSSHPISPSLALLSRHRGCRLHMAAELGDAEAVARLIEAGVDVDCENLIGQTPLCKSAMMGHESLQCTATLLR